MYAVSVWQFILVLFSVYCSDSSREKKLSLILISMCGCKLNLCVMKCNVLSRVYFCLQAWQPPPQSSAPSCHRSPPNSRAACLLSANHKRVRRICSITATSTEIFFYFIIQCALKLKRRKLYLLFVGQELTAF